MELTLEHIENEYAPENEPERQYFFMDKLRGLLERRASDRKKAFSYCVVTFGCQMNFRDSEKLDGVLSEIGMVPADEKEADLVLYNTCTIRENADQRLLGHLGQMKNLKTGRPDLMVGICGCMMQDKKSVEFINEKFGFIDLIFGTHNLYRLSELLYRLFAGDGKVQDIEADSDRIVENLPVVRKHFFRSGVNISFGCDNFCTYCIVPYVRGREKSRKAEDIINEIKTLRDDGVIEIMLLGQNVNSYGKGLEPFVSFPALLKKVGEIEGIERIRFMTSNPHDLSDELIEIMENSSKICTHFHLPLQSGSNKILKLMNRKYTRELFMEKAFKLRQTVPDIAITTDIMVGFPHEEEQDFLDTLDVVNRVGFDNAFTFIYSKRNGTAAARMSAQVEEEVVKDRFDRLLKVVRENASKRAEASVGRIFPVLVEGINSHDAELLSGRLSNNMIVHFKADKKLIGKIVDVKINVSKGFYYLGELIQ